MTGPPVTQSSAQSYEDPAICRNATNICAMSPVFVFVLFCFVFVFVFVFVFLIFFHLRVRTVAKRHIRSSMFTASLILVSFVKLT